MMFRPGGILWLLRHELRLSWRGWMSGNVKKRGNAGRFVLYAFLALAVLGGGYGVAQLLGAFEPVASPAVLGIVGAVFALIATLMLSQALVLITDALYQRGDMDLLLASPLPPWRVLLVRMAAIALNVATLYLIFICAVTLWLPFSGGWRWLGFAPAVLALTLLVTAIGLVLSRGLFALIGPSKTRVAAQVLGALIGAAFFMLAQAQNFVPYDEREAMFMRALGVITSIFGDAASPLSLPGRAALGEPVALAIWVFVSVTAYVLAVWWFARRFVANAAAIAGMSGAKKRDKRTKAMRGGLIPVLLRKEWRLLLRDPLLLSLILLQLFYLVPLIFILWRNVGDDTFSRGGIALFSGAFVVLASTLSGSLTWLTVSAEDAPDLITAAPVTRDKVEQAKALAAGLPVGAIMLLPAIGAAFIAPMAGVWLLIGSGLAIMSSGLIGIWHQRPGSRKNFRRRRGQTIAASIGQSFITFGWAGATGLAVAGWAIVAVIPALISLGVLLALHESRKPFDLAA
jgi:ABC-2 type transport system permease protein